MKYIGDALLFFVVAQVSAAEPGHDCNTAKSPEEHIQLIEQDVRRITQESRKLREMAGLDSTDKLGMLANRMRKLHQEKEDCEALLLRN